MAEENGYRLHKQTSGEWEREFNDKFEALLAEWNGPFVGSKEDMDLRAYRARILLAFCVGELAWLAGEKYEAYKTMPDAELARMICNRFCEEMETHQKRAAIINQLRGRQ